MTTIMEQVVERGTARAAQIPGYTIAGKTGTAAKLVNGHYQKSDYNASFVGFMPSRKPALTILVVIDSPHGKGYTGGAVAAPIFKRIAEAALTYLGIGPNLNAPPPVLVARRDPSRDSDAAPQPARAASVLSATVEPARNGLMPDLRGLSAREALKALSRIGMTARMTGDGFVLEQSPEAGAALVRGERLRADARPPRAGRRHRRRAVTLRELLATSFRLTAEATAEPSTRRSPARLRLAAGDAGRGLRRPARRQRRRRAVRAAGDRQRRHRRRRGNGRARRRRRALAPGAERARGARRDGRGLLRQPERGAGARRHHRHQRQDDDDLRAGVDLRSGGHPVRPHRHHRLPRRRRASSTRRARRRRRPSCSGCCARC